MKKILKQTLLISSLSATIIGGVLSTACSNVIIKKADPNTNIEEIAQAQMSKNIVELQNEADINLYFSAWGIQTFYNLIRLAMCSDKEVHFFYTTALEFQRKINACALEDFLKNKRVVDNKNETNIRQNSRVNSINTTNYDTAAKKFEEIIKQNPDKKINIFINSDHIRIAPAIIGLLEKYKNVQIKGIEDSNMYSQYVLDQYLPRLKYWYWNKEENTWNLPKRPDRESQYILPRYIDGLDFYFSSNSDVKKFIKEGLLSTHPFFYNDNETEIKDYIFNKRDINNKRLFSYWSKISNLNWEKVGDVVKQDFENNQKPSLIILGSGNPVEDKIYIGYIAAKYSDEYNIYYKGHPGHNEIATWVDDNFVKKHNSVQYFDYQSNSWKYCTLKQGNIVRAVETQIQSEELTSDHVLEENGLKFDKWASLDFTTSALIGLVNGYNALEDFIEIKYDQNSIDKTSSNYTEKLEELLSIRLAPRYISINLKNESINKNKDSLNIDDFNISTTSNSYMNIINKPKIIQVNKLENNIYEYVFKLQVKFTSLKASDTIYQAIIKIKI
ncbi:hypothetical protein [Mycoplasma seminis]|uniref:Lipoprotein n=1 Tax=Mycoplasma seminis TaxID=512749 RepID=A0ABY9HBC0_9MOLU|nr:hypothetical protein [Mycoplasma seminis]WLP85864.1 hypothetical protein Q8852_01815 [Mycoplasma seminis]